MNIDYPATIIKLRAILNLSQAELVELLGVSFFMLQNTTKNTNFVEVLL